MANKIGADQLASAIAGALEDYAACMEENMKSAVKNAGVATRDQIKATAPKNTGDYADSWAVKKTTESSTAYSVTVHSQNRYQLAHLLEFGHAKRGGGRTVAQPHLAAAEEFGAKQLESNIVRMIKRG